MVSTVVSQQEGPRSVEFACSLMCSREFLQVCVVVSSCQCCDELATYQVCSMLSPSVCWDRLQHDPMYWGEWMDIMNHVTSDRIVIATLHGLAVPVIVGEVGYGAYEYISPPLSCGSQ